MRTKQKKASRDFFCETCKQKDPMTLDVMKEHFETVHQIDVTKTKGTRQMVMHLNEANFYQSNYKWTFGTVEMTEVACNTRSKADRALWGSE